MYVETKEIAKTVRKALRKACKEEGTEALKVNMDKGTAYGWIRISGTADEFGHFTEAQKTALKNCLGMENHGCNMELISPDDDMIYYGKALKFLGNRTTTSIPYTAEEQLERSKEVEKRHRKEFMEQFKEEQEELVLEIKEIKKTIATSEKELTLRMAELRSKKYQKYDREPFDEIGELQNLNSKISSLKRELVSLEYNFISVQLKYLNEEKIII